MRYLMWTCVVLGACGDDGGTADATDARPDTGDVIDTTEDTAVDTVDTADTAVDTADTAVDTADTADTAVDTADTADTAVDTADTADGDTSTTLGFDVRVPVLREIPYEQMPGETTTIEQRDIDYVCKVDADGFDGWVYVRADAVSCGGFIGCRYDVSGAWQKVGDTISELAGASYDYGGNHHNDYLLVPHGDHTLKIYHSSFGFGWRACHPPDCAQIYSGADLLTDGCGADRALPSPCVLVQPDGSVPPIVDTFEKCPGDPNVTPE